jgi:glycyl-tRNA synthetase (class II)
MMGYDAADKRNERDLASREKVANAEIMARKDIANWDNKTKMDVVNATNQMHKEVQKMVGEVQEKIANIKGRYDLQSQGISAGATMGAAQLGRTARLEEAIINNRARLVNIEENAVKAIDAAAAKERAALMALVPSTGPNAAQRKQLDAIDSGAEALKTDLRARMNQQISDVGLTNILGPSPLGGGSGGKYTVTRE